MPIVDRGKRGAGGAAPSRSTSRSRSATRATRSSAARGTASGPTATASARERRDDLPYLRDIRERRLASHVALVRQSDRAVLARSTVRTDLVSLQRVRGAALLRCRHLAGRCLRELRDGVGIAAEHEEPGVTQVVSGSPSVGSLLSTVVRILLRLLGHRVNNALWHEQWSAGRPAARTNGRRR